MAGPYDLAFHEQVSSEVAAQEKAQTKENEPVKEEPKQEEVVEEKQETTETTEQETSEQKEPEKQEKLYANKYKTVGQLFKACEVISAELGEDIEISDMNAKEAEEYYLKAQKRFFAGGFKRNRERAEQVKAAAKQDQLTTQQLNEFIKQQEQPAKKAVVFDKKKYAELFLEDPEAAADMLDQYIESKIDARVTDEGEKFGKALSPILQREQEKVNNDNWVTALDNVDKFVKEHGKGNFKALEKDMDELVKENREFYRHLIKEEGYEEAVLHLYRRADERATYIAERAQFEKEKSEFAKRKNGEVDDEVQAAKEAARIANTTGGVTPKIANGKKLTEADMVHSMLSSNKKKGPYDQDF